MSLIGSMFSGLVAAFVVSTPHVDASLGGFALAFALSYRRAVNQTLRLVAATELDMNAAERIFEYSNLDIEDKKGVDVRASWPEKGELEVKDLEVGYAEGLPSILKGLNFHAGMNQRVGIVGRTGAGKAMFYSSWNTANLAMKVNQPCHWPYSDFWKPEKEASPSTESTSQQSNSTISALALPSFPKTPFFSPEQSAQTSTPSTNSQSTNFTKPCSEFISFPL